MMVLQQKLASKVMGLMLLKQKRQSKLISKVKIMT
jgi:hypothetical protein